MKRRLEEENTSSINVGQSLRQLFDQIHRHNNTHQAKKPRKSSFFPLNDSNFVVNTQQQVLNTLKKDCIEFEFNVQRKFDRLPIHQNENDTAFDLIVKLESIYKNYQRKKDDVSVNIANIDAFFARWIALRLIYLSSHKTKANGKVNLNQIQVLCAVIKYFMGRHEFNRCIFLEYLSNPTKHIANMVNSIIDIHTLQILDREQIIAFDQFIELICNITNNSEIFASRISELDKADPVIDKLIHVILKMYSNEKYKKAATTMTAALRKWKSNYYVNSRSILEFYLKLLRRAVSDTDFISKEITALLLSNNSFDDIYKFVNEIIDNDNGEDAIIKDLEDLALQQLVHLLSTQQIIKIIDTSIRSLSCDWRFLIRFLIFLCGNIAGEIYRFINESIDQAIALEYSELLIVLIILARYIYSGKNKQVQPYETWIKNRLFRYFASSKKEMPISAKSLKKFRSFILSTLIQMIPYDSINYLKQMVVLLENALDCSEYISAVKDRLKIIGVSTDKFSVNHFTKANTSSAIPIKEEVKRCLDEFFDMKMQKIPAILQTKQYLQRSWFTKLFLPNLLLFEESGAERTKYRMLVKNLLMFLIERKMIDAVIIRKYEKQIMEIQNFEPENDEDEEKIIYDIVEDNQVKEIFDKEFTLQKKFQLAINQLKEGTNHYISIDRWINCFTSIKEIIEEINNNEITQVDMNQYTDSIMILFCEISYYISIHSENYSNLESFCSLFCNHILYPFTQIYLLLERKLIDIVYHPKTNMPVSGALGILSASMLELKYFKEKDICLPTIAENVLIKVFPRDPDKFSFLSLSFLKYAFSRFNPISCNSFDLAYRSGQLIYIPSAFVFKATWSIERLALINNINTMEQDVLLYQSFHNLENLESFSNFIRNKSIPIQTWISCEMVVSKEIDSFELVNMIRNRVFTRYLDDYKDSIHELFLIIIDQMINCHIENITDQVQLSIQGKHAWVTVLQELQVLIRDNNVFLFDILKEKINGLSCDHVFKLLECFGELIGMLDSKLIFPSVQRHNSPQESFKEITCLLNSFNHIYPWSHQFVCLFLRGVIDIFSIYSEDEDLNKCFMQFLQSTPLFRICLLKLWDHRYKSYIGALIHKLQLNYPLLSPMVKQALVTPLSNINIFLELLFKEYQQRDSTSMIALCSQHPLLFSISLIEYSVCIICSIESSPSTSSSYILSQSSFPLSKRFEYNINVQAIYTRVLITLACERSKLLETSNNAEFIEVFFITTMYILIHCLINHTIFKFGSYSIKCAQFSEYGFASMEELKIFACKCITVFPELIFVFSEIMSQIDIRHTTENQLWSVDKSILDCSIVNNQLTFSSLLKCCNESDHSKVRLAIASIFFLLLTRMSSEWIENITYKEEKVRTAFVDLFSKMHLIIDQNGKEGDPSLNLVATIHKKKIKDFIENQSDKIKFLLRINCCISNDSASMNKTSPIPSTRVV